MVGGHTASKLESRENILVAGESQHGVGLKLHQASAIKVDVKHRAAQKRGDGRQAESGQLSAVNTKNKWKGVPNIHLESADGPIRQQDLLDFSSQNSSRRIRQTINHNTCNERTRHIWKSPEAPAANQAPFFG